MVKNQLAIHSSVQYGNNIGHPSHAQITKSNKQAKQSNKAKPSIKQNNQSTLSIYKQPIKQCSEIAAKEGSRNRVKTG